ncbi:hypothetical protein [Hyphococcus sp.]|uniref:hypothetical protein n=1 Tax=Hyphococcus sp. TaxID=2038636 RepID=UPI0035C68E86
MKSFCSILAAAFAASCFAGAASAQGLLDRLQGSKDAHVVKDTEFRMIGCELTPDRSAICRLEVTNNYRDKKIEISHGIKLQDDLGDEYPVQQGGFGTNTSRPKWDQVAIADSTYQLTVIAANLSSRATSVRAVVFPRILVRTPQGQALGYTDQVVFAKPKMMTPEEPAVEMAAATTPAAAEQSSPAPKPAQEQKQPKTPAKKAVQVSTAAEPSFPTGDYWIVLGLWDYDAVDGQQLPANGFVLRPVSGSNLGVRWSGHLELKNHQSLAPRVRTLWPVSVNPAQRKVCANYPDYPTYEAYIDMPGAGADGTYHVSNCNSG